MTIYLGGYPAKTCARATHNRYSPTAPDEPDMPESVQELLDGGIVFETQIVDEIVSLHGPAAVVIHGDSWGDETAETMRAAAARAPIIIGGRLPRIDGRVGAPDVLLRHGDGYLPVDIKSHKTLGAPPANPSTTRARATLSTLADPTALSQHPHSPRGGHWRDDTMQLAHYTRMLQTLGLHPGGSSDQHPETLIGGIIGTSDLTALTGDSVGVTWYDLTEPAEKTYSASGKGNRAARSPLQRYDHEFAFRLKVAEEASFGREIVRPYGISDCPSCVWLDYCRDVAGPEDASFAITTGRLDVREWQALYGPTATLTISGLAQLDPDQVAAGFEAYSVGKAKPRQRLENVIRRARMITDGRDLEPLQPGTRITVPSADIEVDYDIEWDRDGRIYQWGLRVRDGQDDSTARYEPVVSFEPLDPDAEQQLADEFAARIAELADDAARAGKTFAVYHWHHVELSRTRRFAAVQQALDGRTTDLLNDWFAKQLFARTDSSIKSIAPMFGFSWGLDDAGGLMSQVKVETARAASSDAADARDWCLRYNEADVAAQAAIRDGVRRWVADAHPPR